MPESYNRRRSSVVSYVQTILVALLVSAVVTSLGLWLQSHPQNQTSPEVANRKSAYQRVLQTSTIRCGYVVYAPGIIKDPNTGHISGIVADAVQAAATNLNLHVAWVEEVGWDTMIEGLRTGRYDLVCAPIWPDALRSKLADFSVPLYYSAVGVYVRADDQPFTNNLPAINSPNVKIATIDGEITQTIARQQFPNASVDSHPELSDIGQLLLDVATRKADVTFVDNYAAGVFLRNNPRTVKNITASHPIRVFPNTLMVNKGENQLLSMMNVALGELINAGYLDRLLGNYSKVGDFYPVAYPYRSPTSSNP